MLGKAAAAAVAQKVQGERRGAMDAVKIWVPIQVRAAKPSQAKPSQKAQGQGRSGIASIASLCFPSRRSRVTAAGSAGAIQSATSLSENNKGILVGAL